jgi:hypothetical protein
MFVGIRKVEPFAEKIDLDLVRSIGNRYIYRVEPRGCEFDLKLKRNVSTATSTEHNPVASVVKA